MIDNIAVKLFDKVITVKSGISLLRFLKLHGNLPDIVGAKVNNCIQPLDYLITENCFVEPIVLGSIDGIRIYRNSVVFLLARASKEVLPGSRLHIEHSLSNGFYGEIEFEHPLIECDIEKIEKRMREIIDLDEPFIRTEMPVTEASRVYSRQGLHDKVRLLNFSEEKYVTVYKCGWYHDYISGVMVSSTKQLSCFKLKYYLPGFIIEFPTINNPKNIPEFVEQRKLSNVYFQAEKWAKNMEVSDAPALNQVIEKGDIEEFIRVSEAYHEKQIAAIADKIADNRDRLRVILIAGPSSSGKTTFAHRLSIHLRVNGLRPRAISLDDYFVDRDKTPVDENGNKDFEALEAIDIKLFNEHLSKLIQGEAIELPTYNFSTGKREWRGKVFQVSAKQPIIIEGIHGLNEKLTAAIPQGRKFKVYVSALTNLNIDDHNRIPTTDVRLLRRIIRDNQFRSYKAIETINRWPSVRRGEEKHIFPYQEDADVMFNSALLYELAVIKNHAKPLLQEISINTSEYWESKRLLLFMSYFHSIENENDIPCNSILREFIG